MKIKFKGLGFKIEVECENGATCSEAVALFENVTGKVMEGMDLFNNGTKIEDLDAPAPKEIVAVKSKHESA